MVAFRVKGKRGKLVPQDSPLPHRCVVLGVDPATNCGWAVASRGGVVRAGEVGYDDPKIASCIQFALFESRRLGWPCVLVLEHPILRGAGALKLGAARDSWVSRWWEYAGPHGHAKKQVSVYPPTWRSRLLGVTRGAQLPRLEHSFANAALPPALTTQPDRNAAICIASWGTTAGEVAAVIPRAFWGHPQDPAA